MAFISLSFVSCRKKVGCCSFLHICLVALLAARSYVHRVAVLRSAGRGVGRLLPVGLLPLPVARPLSFRLPTLFWMCRHFASTSLRAIACLGTFNIWLMVMYSSPGDAARGITSTFVRNHAKDTKDSYTYTAVFACEFIHYIMNRL